MHDVKKMTESELINALIVETSNYIHLISSHNMNVAEYQLCKQNLLGIQEELDLRHIGREEN